MKGLFGQVDLPSRFPVVEDKFKSGRRVGLLEASHVRFILDWAFANANKNRLIEKLTISSASSSTADMSKSNRGSSSEGAGGQSGDDPFAFIFGHARHDRASVPARHDRASVLAYERM